MNIEKGREEHERGWREEGERLVSLLVRSQRKGKLWVKCRRRAKGDFVAREG